ncbi:MAG: S46 family peptidase [Bacteroidaceae bacterium]|nr:S46 family peptidase [Bacteroidaceae bacterium]
MKLQFILAALLTVFSFQHVKADEGMWLVSHISERTDSILHSLGLELSYDEIYNSSGPCLNNAIIQLGGFCSGTVVSNDGLVFTNHHCGYGAIQDHSTTKHDYLKDGFYAKTFADELPNEDLYVLFHLKTVDVTDLILGAVPDGVSNEIRAYIVDSVSNRLMEMVDYPAKGVFAEVNPFYRGSKYFLSLYQRFDDVRLVYAPPQCLGKYGGDTDNWMWPRQTCDFSVFRIYADENNQPAGYSKDNVPYHPQFHASISLQGYDYGSYSMTLGYPGGTDRYLSSYGIENLMNGENDVRYQVRTVKLDILNEAMRNNDELRIKYASKYASSANYWKFSLGQNTALTNLNVIDEKKQAEAEVQRWIDADTLAHSRYVGVLDSLKAIYDAEAAYNYGITLWSESFLYGSDVLAFVLKNMTGRIIGDEGSSSFKDIVNKTYSNIDIATDKKVFLALLQNYMKNVPFDEMKPMSLVSLADSLGGYEQAVDYLYANSVFCNPERLYVFDDFSETASDPMVDVAIDVFSLSISAFGMIGRGNEYERLLGEAIREMNHEKEFYPDANFTMRLSYGVCKPIDFAPGAVNLKEEATNLVTSTQSFLNKHEREYKNKTRDKNYDFELIDPVYKWMKSRKFSKRYIDKHTGQLPLCFLTTNDITGGNSGSGMFDGRGRLFGLAFDGNWEAMSGDIKFDNSLQRCIGVDIRWVLSVMDDYSHAKRLIDELTIEE